MKKLWLMLLIGCTAGVFAACTDDDNASEGGGGNPSNPISNYSIESPAEIGGTLKINGTGFDAASAKIYLKSKAGVETAVEDPQFSETGVACTVPATLEEGVYTVIVKQNGSWELGTVTLQKAENPILSLAMPAAIKLNHPFEIAGNGFTEEMELFLETADDAKTRTKLDAKLSAVGVTCTAAEGTAAGSYNIILKEGANEWMLGSNIPAAVYKRLAGIMVSMKQTPFFDRLSAEELAALKAQLKLMLEAEGMPSDDASVEAAIQMYFYMDTPLAMMSFKYDAEGRISSVVNEAYGLDWYAFTIDGDKYTATNKLYEDGQTGATSFVWNLNDGRVESSTGTYMKSDVNNPGQVVPTSSDHTWNYDANLYCTDIVFQSSGKEYETFSFENGNYTAGGYFSYTGAEKRNNIFGVDVARAIQAVSADMDDLVVLASLLNLTGTASAYLPTSTLINAMDENPMPLNYEQDAADYVTTAKWGTEGMDMMFQMVPAISETVIEFTYEE